MEYLIKTTLIGLFFGTFGTTIGGIIGIVFKNTSNKFLGFILSLASGLMISIVCFDLIPEALEISSIALVILGLLSGVICMIICDIIVQKKFQTSSHYTKNTNSLLKTGIIVSIGLALHNFPEGLAIGSGFGASIKLGYSLAVAILLHDIPERSIYGSANEKWRNEKIKSYILRCVIRSYNRDRSIIWSINTELFHKK
jgi:ZIP family zinc transporter